MGLVGYSDSEGSEGEEEQQQQPASKPAIAKPSKPSFQKVVDKSKPNKIQVSLPGTVAADESSGQDGPPAKRAKTAGGFGGFNSFLPAPKNAAAKASAPVAAGEPDKNASPRTPGIGRGVNLKTGAAPAFSRERPSAYEADGTPRANAPIEIDEVPVPEVKLVGKPMAFKPLSVSRKPKKKGIGSKPASVTAVAHPDEANAEPVPAARKKTSLFSAATEEAPDPPSSTTIKTTTQYTPMTLEIDGQPDTLAPSSAEAAPHLQQAQPTPATAPTNDLSTLATTLNLSAAEKRQLFGRNGPTNAQVAQFNLAAEYQSNRALAESADAMPAHNAVRSIASGKHSLQQLINNAQSQKDALEESFARGKGNKKEAGTRYGW